MNQTYTSALSPEYALLGFLAQAEAHGYDLHRKLSNELGQVWHISLSQTYNILKRLEGQGFINGSLQEQDRLPARTCFRLTQAGRARLEDWLRKPTGCSVRAIRVEFITRLYFAPLLGPATAGQMIEAQLAETRGGLEALRSQLGQIESSQPFNQIGLDLRIRQLEAVIGWLESLPVMFNQAR
jgi:PadR family transcriptional regulator, regulatory protein AphA